MIVGFESDNRISNLLKIFWLQIENPFMTENFIWLDAGYGHGNRAIFPPDFNWNPSLPPEKISLIKVRNNKWIEFDLKGNTP